eukprot:CAMPEP_0202710814 /NCGR_PEP_ID=MMETSP1385-20130828/22733_1 /ASSEMBLY_ACC=CAM_ASM_000861 /TAXON_ID=933848 /ORGANISM="Elphidium margaritaceum" /LENGTH=185 /DNA_ID=CAMNT_0049370421 /DNA_START=295 /DNA_END=852 /DNA_ORIENTATION=-
MSIKVLKHCRESQGFSIGILTNSKVCTDEWVLDSAAAHTTYQLYVGCKDDRNPSGIYGLSGDGCSKTLDCIQQIDLGLDEDEADTVNPVDNADTTDIDAEQKLKQETQTETLHEASITMHVDCDRWEMRFFYNEVQLGNSFKIKPGPMNGAYYATFAYGGNAFIASEKKVPAQYQLLLHTQEYRQ